MIMKHKALLLACLGLTALAAGCKQEPTAAQQIEKIKADTQEAAQDMKDYTFAQKAEFTAQMKVQLAAIKSDLDQLDARIENSSDAVKLEAKPKMKALREQEAQLNQQLDAAQNASESAWDDVKSASRKTYESLKDGFQQSRQWVSDKIAP